jgi:hypothetical protein
VTRYLAGFVVFASAASAGIDGKPIDPKEIVRQSIQNYERDWRAAMRWAYTQTDVTSADGAREIEVSQVVPLVGTPYERLMMKDGHLLTPEEKSREDRKFERTERQREKESPAEREARIRKYENERAFVKELPDAYDFTLVGEQSVENRAAWVIEMKPRSGFTPRSMRAAMLQHIEGKLWIDKEDLQWAKAEAHVVDRISIGWILARIGPGTHFTVEQCRVADGLWMPKHITIKGMARVMMVHTKNINEDLRFSGYHEESELAEKR